MNKQEFLDNVRNQFDMTPPSEIMMDTKFEDIDEWCSLVGLGVMSMIKDIYGIKLSFAQMSNISSVNDLYDLVTEIIKDE